MSRISGARYYVILGWHEINAGYARSYMRRTCVYTRRSALLALDSREAESSCVVISWNWLGSMYLPEMQSHVHTYIRAYTTRAASPTIVETLRRKMHFEPPRNAKYEDCAPKWVFLFTQRETTALSFSVTSRFLFARDSDDSSRDKRFV